MNDGYDMPQLKFRDQHRGGIGWENIKLTHERSAQERLRAKPDRRLFQAMDPWQVEAFLLVREAKKLLENPTGMKARDYTTLGGRSLADPLKGKELLKHYLAWKDLCRLRHLSPMMAEDVIIEGLSLRESDRERRMKHGTAKKNLMACLSAWWEVK